MKSRLGDFLYNERNFMKEKLFFLNDYSQGAHINILNKLIETNNENLIGYGEDKYSKLAKESIKKISNRNDLDIYFLSGGTQSNAIVINSILKDYEAIIAPNSAHILTMEAGAIEFTGHKIINLNQIDGKLIKKDLEEYMQKFINSKLNLHMPRPAMVFISQPTELGTIYSKNELIEIYEVCKKYSLKLYIDGARLGYALVSNESDLTLEDIAKYSDVFYIGGTKVGTLNGEAVVFSNMKEPDYFITRIKQQGGLLAKSRLLGIQFYELFKDGLYFKISKNAIDLSNFLKIKLIEKGYKFYTNSNTNQLFPILDNKKIEDLEKNVEFTFWDKYDENNSVIRLVISWYTKREDIEKLLELM